MVLVVTTLVAALVIGLAAGGRLGNLGRTSFRGTAFVVLGLSAQLLLAWLSGQRAEGVAGLPLLIASQVALLVFFWLNRRLPGIPLAFAGFVMNTFVIIANGAMPVSERALQAVAVGDGDAVIPGKHRLLEAGDPLPFLADVIPIAPLRTVVSIGDVVLAAGAAILIVSLMRRPPHHQRSQSSVADNPSRNDT